jgi:glycosyltransferase involved in cell wall biosynthesis
MKICVISNLYKPHTRGGAERIVELQVDGLKNHGHELVVISTKPEGGLKVEKNKNEKIYRFKPLNLFYYLEDYKHNAFVRAIWHVLDTFNLYSAVRVMIILLKEKPKLVITHNLKGIGLLVPVVIKLLRKNHYHVLHDVQLSVPSGLIIKNEENGFLQVGFPTKIYRFITKILFGNPKKVIFPSVWLKDYHDSFKFFKKSHKQLLRNPLPKLDSYISIKEKKNNSFGYIGQVEDYKGVKWLADIWDKKKIEAELVIIGKGESDLSEYKKQKTIKVLGFQKKKEFEKIFQGMDFLIVPSLCYENSPTVILEAMQYATPVIVANIGGAAELIIPGETGYIFEPVDDKSFIEVLYSALNLNNQEYKEFSRNSLLFSQKLDMDNYVVELLEN